jgi:hypothetical protein
VTGRHQAAVPSPRPAADRGLVGHEELSSCLAAARWVRVSARAGVAERWLAPSQVVWIVVPTDVADPGYEARLAEAWAVWAQVLADAGIR